MFLSKDYSKSEIIFGQNFENLIVRQQPEVSRGIQIKCDGGGSIYVER